MPWLIGSAAVLAAIILAAVACNVTGTPTAGPGSTTTTPPPPTSTGVVVVPPPTTSGSEVPPATTASPPPATTAAPPTGSTGPTSTKARPKPPHGVNAGSGGQGDSSGPLDAGALLLVLAGAGAIAAGVTMVRRSDH